jgi:Mg-chelatase subunit ChlD
MKIYNLIILDESGSMCSIKKQAIDGFNETVQTIKAATKKHAGQQHLVSLVTFNGAGIKTVYDKMDAGRVDELNDRLYDPDCDTPLYDAMGKSLTELKKSVNAEDNVLITIITDGEENASREYTQSAIKALVEELKAKGWVFTYIGANQDVKKVSATIAITNVMSFQATEAGTSVMFSKERSSRERYYDAVANKSDEPSQSNFFGKEE